MLNYQRYERVSAVYPPEKTWPEKEIQSTPIQYSVDLRDGNQVLVEPTVVEEKIEMSDLLVKLGLKKARARFPAASRIEYDFPRQPVGRKLIPDDVVIQALVRRHEHLIKRTFETIKDVRRSIVHIYNSTSILQRGIVFYRSMEEIKGTAVEGTDLVKKYAKHYDDELFPEYSPESFTDTRLDYALDICTVMQEAQGMIPDNKIIISLPSIAEMTAPNVCVDQIGWMNMHFKDRDNIILSVHFYDGRGIDVAVTELALLADANRVEGTLFGNGERTGNVDILTLAYSMFLQGINPELNIKNIREISNVYERYTKMNISPRHPYAGKLVFTAFSGLHQDAINGGMQALHERNGEYWEVPYLPIDPSNIGRQCEPIVRINSQSSKGGVAFVMDIFYSSKLSKGAHKEFIDVIQKISEKQGEVAPEQIMDEFRSNYSERKEPIHFRKCQITDTEAEGGEFATLAKATFTDYDVEKHPEGIEDGSIDAIQNGLEPTFGIKIRILGHNEHALTSGSGTQAVPYTHLVNVETGRVIYGVGVGSNITRAPIRDIFSTVNRLLY